MISYKFLVYEKNLKTILLFNIHLNFIKNTYIIVYLDILN